MYFTLVTAGWLHSINLTHILTWLTKSSKITRVHIFSVHFILVSDIACCHLTEICSDTWGIETFQNAGVLRIGWLLDQVSCYCFNGMEVYKWIPKPHDICFLKPKINMRIELSTLNYIITINLNYLNQKKKKKKFFFFLPWKQYCNRLQALLAKGHISSYQAWGDPGLWIPFL